MAFDALEPHQDRGSILFSRDVDPANWQPNGGPGVIVYDPITDALIVRASAEMHHMIGGSGLIRSR